MPTQNISYRDRNIKHHKRQKANQITRPSQIINDFFKDFLLLIYSIAIKRALWLLPSVSQQGFQ